MGFLLCVVSYCGIALITTMAWRRQGDFMDDFCAVLGLLWPVSIPMGLLWALGWGLLYIAARIDRIER